jgi:putative Holliday junction resolvase
MKYLALDMGEKRIGVAVTDEEGIIARPLLTIPNSPALMSDLGKIIKEEAPARIILGIPRHMSGDESQKATQIREFAKGIEHEFGVEIDFQDETASSIEAEKRLTERGTKGEEMKKSVDAEAAAVILEDYLAG